MEEPEEEVKQVEGKEHMSNEDPGTMLKLIEKLESQDVYYNYIRHKPVITSEEVALARELPHGSGINALFVKEKKTKKFHLFCLPENERMDGKKVRGIINTYKFSFAK